MSEEQVAGIHKEIGLMKRLSHPNIVSYIDVISTPDYLNIVMEFVENGSLAGSIKHFSPFKEHLVALFTRQILSGLSYLHSQGVVHRDIKGANLLSTKDGVLKLADFGVAMKLTESIKSMSIVGTPYWMAPEIVEQTHHCTTACDIWSLGCTIVELFTGAPPYFDLGTMSALYRIVQDECPPLPTGCTSEMTDFLLKCFQKEPLIRVDAPTLLRHPWVLEGEPPPPQPRAQRAGEGKKPRPALHSTKVESDDFGSLGSLQKLSANRLAHEESYSGSYDGHELDKIIEKLDNAETLTALVHLLRARPSLRRLAQPAFPALKQTLEEADAPEALLALQALNAICEAEPQTQEAAACIGLLAAALRFLGEEFCKELRIEAAYLVGQLFQAPEPVGKLMLAAGGLEHLVSLLDLNYEENRDLVNLGVDCLLALANDQSYLIVWASCGALERLVVTLDNLAADGEGAGYLDKTACLLRLFSESPAAGHFCEEDVLNIVTATLHSLPAPAQSQLLTALQNLCSERQLQDKLENIGLIVDLVKVLGARVALEVRELALNCLVYLCKMSPPRQEQAVLAGAVPYLQEIADSLSTKAPQALSLLCSFVSASPAARRSLHTHNVLQFLLENVEKNPGVLDAIATWVASEPKKCQGIVSKDENVGRLIRVFSSKPFQEQTLQCIKRVLDSSKTLRRRLGFDEDFMRAIFKRLVESRKNAGIVKNSLDLLHAIVSVHPLPRQLLDQHDFYPLAVKILHDSREEDLVVIEETTTLLLSIYSQGKVKCSM